ncbi:ABC transporter permease [Rubinisphaera margarita]|uniref:ABC transporter permease n=1 Tax=Rubinisphaera margarita TaxID=2909586 RepID=UPI001EE94F40|nr:FtsX-like permease family protein [Rubinisphaera margarita]MCG6157043.1 FtsX-like permease family protein [Rubinisphaera margarita]
MYKTLLCQRYLRTRYIALASIISVMLGVATMIVVNSVMSGFSSQMRDRIHGLLADVVIESHSYDGVSDPDLQIRIAREVADDYIEAITPTVEVYGMLNFNFAGQWITKPVTLIGIEPEGKAKVGPLRSFLDSYNPVYEENQIARDALRPDSEQPNWNLSKDAIEYRREKIDRQKWYEEQLAAMEKAEAPLIDPAAATTEGETPDAAMPNDPFADPFGDSTAAKKDADPADPYALMDGRVYVGVGLVSYPYRDPETGKMKTMMMAKPGDDVKVSTVTAGRPPSHAAYQATIVDVFKSGMTEYDSNLVFCNLDELQEVRGMLSPATGKRAITSLHIKLKDYTQASDVVERLKSAFPPDQFVVKTWEQKQGPLLAAVEVESAILNVLLFLIIAVAGFGILAIFYMIVVEKTRDIGILKALGASSSGIMSIFLSYGLSLGVVGSGVGVVLGLMFVHYINEIEDVITWVTGRKVFDETIYYFPEIPTAVHPSMVVSVALGAMLIAVLASVFPARRAARMHPVESLRRD